jgi:hypothetical protein
MLSPILFFCILSAAALFHRWEHESFEGEIRRIATDPAQISAMDWRIIESNNGIMMIKRAFNPRGFSEIAHYATPLVLFAAMLLGAGSWKMASGYAVICIVKWFASAVRVDTREGRGEYSVLLLGQRLFGAVF